MSSTTANQEQSVPAKDVNQATAETVSENDASKTENGTGTGAPQEEPQQTGTGPKVLRSHFRGMPRQWEKNRRTQDEEYKQLPSVSIHAAQPLLEFLLLPLQLSNLGLCPPQLLLCDDVIIFSRGASPNLFIVLIVVHPVVFVHLPQGLGLLFHLRLVVGEGAPAVCVFGALRRDPLERAGQCVHAAELLGAPEQDLDVDVVLAAAPFTPPDLVVQGTA
ncbi:hypothetical protein ONZ43_g6303 [Nemania bipapillata]|uniref:Uncharacterized protein n=1 Tax=Nemania bipapillata TaxID=110536 RepID=A0ACC2I0H0_9PEZI|nr:hypothetical protein ONZ43_g6303 [Nemania bipapillata]